MPELSGFLTSEARFFVKLELHKKCGVFSACKKVTDFFDTLEKLTALYEAVSFSHRERIITALR